MQQIYIKSGCILLLSAEKKRTIVLAGGSWCIGQPAHFSAVTLCCMQQDPCEMSARVRPFYQKFFK